MSGWRPIAVFAALLLAGCEFKAQATYQSRPIEASGELGRIEAGAVSCFRPEPGVNCYVLKPIGQFSSLSCVVSPTTGGHALCPRLPEPPDE